MPDRKRQPPRPASHRGSGNPRTQQRRSRYWIYGLHAVAAALANPERRVERLLATPELLERGLGWLNPKVASPTPRHELERRLPPGAVHQGVAAEVEPLPELDIEDICRATVDAARAAIVVLDMVTDPQNVGAVLRTAAALGAAAIVLPEHGAPEATGALAKAASGALETVPLVRVVNLRRALDSLKEARFWCVGLAGSADAILGDEPLPSRAALVLGSEGTGLRRLTEEACDLRVRIPIAAAVESLNVSVSAALALYEWRRPTRS